MKNKIKTLLVATVILFATSCSGDWLDVNTDPNVPTTPHLGQLLTDSQMRLANAFSHGAFIGNHLSGLTHHWVFREVMNNDAWIPGMNNPQNTWWSIYALMLPGLQTIIDVAIEEDKVLYAGIAKTLKAFAFSKVVDLWGDVPFSEANNPYITAPRADRSADIYNALFVLLDEAMAHFNNDDAENAITPGRDDVFFGGDIDRWKQVNNTIQLRMLLNSRNARSEITGWQTRLTALMAADNFMEQGGDLDWWHTPSASPDERSPLFVADWLGGQATRWISPFFYEMVMGLTYNNVNNPFVGIVDPRVPYFIFRPMRPGEEDDEESTHSYLHGTFLSIFFADIGSNVGANQHTRQARVGLYVTGGLFDDGRGRINATGPPGIVAGNAIMTNGGMAPLRLLSYHSLQFMLAELALVGAISGDPRAFLQAGLEASIFHVNMVADRHSAPLITSEARDAFVNQVLMAYDGATTDEGRMEVIMTQKWIANFGSAVEAYTDIRRTGFPVLFNPANTQVPGWGFNPIYTERSPRNAPIQAITPFPRSLYYPGNTETGLNPNLPQRTNLAVPFIFWDRQ